MKKRYGMWTAMLAVLLAAALLAAGCGGSGKDAGAETTAVTADTSSGSMMEMGAPEEAVAESEAVNGQIASSSGIDSVDTTAQKLIKTVNLTMQTREFDTLLENIQAKTAECGGYVEQSDISGLSYYNTNGYRYAWLTLRIPADRLDEFVTIVSGLGNVTSKNESVDDVTLQYVDVESHIEALETEQARLLELMEQAETMEDIISIESRLSEIRYELQSYESRLRTYDNQVNYSTVTVSIDEVDRETVIEEDPGFFGEIRLRLSDNFYDIGQGLRGFAIWFISSLPYLVLFAAVVWLVIRLLQKIFWKKPFFGRRKKKALEEAAEEQPADRTGTAETERPADITQAETAEAAPADRTETKEE